MAENALITPRFFMHVTPNEVASKSAGRPIFDEFEAVELRYPGDRQKASVFPAHEAEPNATRDLVSGGNGQPGQVVTYAQAYNKQYLEFKNGITQSMSGTPLSELPFLTEGKRRELKALNIHTAEQLASLDGTPLRQLGMGGREMKDQARAYLDNAAGSADVTSQAAEIVSLRRQIADRDEQLAAVKRSEQKSGMPTGKGVGKGAAKGQRKPASDPDGKPSVDAAPSNPEPSAFAEWADEDIREWLADVTKKPVAEDLSRDELLMQADAENERLAKAQANS